MEYDDSLMQEAFDEARKALEIGEVPVGCVFVDATTKSVIARGRNSVNQTKNATRHAELNCIDQVLEDKKSSFQDIIVYVDVEPCIMCASALVDLRVKGVFFGCRNDRFGGCGSVLDVPKLMLETSPPPPPFFSGGYRDQEAVELLKDFYRGENPNAPEDKRKIKTN